MNKTLLIFISHASFFLSHRLELALEAKNKGYNVKVVLGDIDVNSKNLTDLNIDFIHIPLNRGSINPFKDIKSLCLIWKLFKKIKPDIVHLVTIKPYLYGGIIGRLTKVPCIVSAISGLGSLFIEKSLKNSFLRLIIYPFYSFAFNHSNQLVIVQNNEDAKLLENWGVLKPEKVRLIKGSGINLKKFPQNTELMEVTPIICFAARLLKDKGVNEFISSAEILKKRGINGRFILAGGLDQKNPTSLNEKDLNLLKANKSIEILGHQENISELFAKSNIICLPSYREGFPKTLIEASAAGRAVVTTDVPGCRDSIVPGKTGILVPPKNSKKLADAIQFLIENPDKRLSMGKAGRELAEKEYRVENIIQNHFNLYKELISKV